MISRKYRPEVLACVLAPQRYPETAAVIRECAAALQCPVVDVVEERVPKQRAASALHGAIPLVPKGNNSYPPIHKLRVNPNHRFLP